ncbi:ROK family transcriptional regulator [Actinoallomurus purpureus]|uniref:ROK family transcriptional regulator n=1 Tax=Actinoallomurus purpureus TaxID=478114 RepID=UPI00209223DC|nr:ROK family transcriptional regulator [Actinoallomurus purpureus]MCO6003481.1 ROK family transcriptional regulator [Actinoallomurus purpureus]
MIDTPLNLREVGRLRVLEALHHVGRSSRSQLTRLTGLSRATVSSIVADLLSAGLIEEAPDTSEPEGRPTGRPAQPLTLIPSAAYAVGADIGHQQVRVAVCDLNGDPIWDTVVAGDTDRAPRETLDLTADLIQQAIREKDIALGDVLGLGVDIATPVRTADGALEAHGIMPGWVGVRPGRELEERTGLTAQVANDADAGALAERLYGAGRGTSDMIYIRLSTGIGAGIVSGGRPLTGVGGLAGEIGHVVSDPRGGICRCGNRGCLGTVAGPAAIARLLEQSWGRRVTVPDLLRLIDEGDRGAVRALEDAAEHIGIVLADLVTLLNPELIVVGGDLAAAGPLLFAPLERAIRRYALAPAAEAVTVVPGELRDQAEVRGAAGMVLAHAPRILADRLAAAERGGDHHPVTTE